MDYMEKKMSANQKGRNRFFSCWIHARVLRDFCSADPSPDSALVSVGMLPLTCNDPEFSL